MADLRNLSASCFVLVFSACSSGSGSGTKPPADAAGDHMLDAEAGAPDAASDAPLDAPPDSAPDANGGVTAIISQSAGSTFEAETHLVQAPGGRLLAVWMSLGNAIKNGYALSEDGGDHWSSPAIMNVPSSYGDPVATAGPDGSFYYGFLDGTCSGTSCSNGHVWVSRLGPGSSAFETPVDVSPADPAEFYDKPWLMTGSDGSLILTVNGRVGQYPNNVDRIIVARSNNGTNWTRTFAVDAGATGRIAGIPHACVSKTGKRLWIVHVDSDTPIFAAIRWSDDLGVTWPAAQSSFGFASSAEATQIQVYDLRCVGEGNDVWVMYGIATGASSASAIPPLDQIHITHSGDGGSTWDTPAVIQKPGELYLRPEIARDASGALWVMAYAGSQDGDLNGSIRRWKSSDAGKSFTEQSPLYQPIDFTGDRSGKLWIGDYSGLLVSSNELLLTFADNSSGASHIRFVRAAAD